MIVERVTVRLGVFVVILCFIHRFIIAHSLSVIVSITGQLYIVIGYVCFIHNS